jgi:hypothetical protein
VKRCYLIYLRRCRIVQTNAWAVNYSFSVTFPYLNAGYVRERAAFWYYRFPQFTEIAYILGDSKFVARVVTVHLIEGQVREYVETTSTPLTGRDQKTTD